MSRVFLVSALIQNLDFAGRDLFPTGAAQSQAHVPSRVSVRMGQRPSQALPEHIF